MFSLIDASLPPQKIDLQFVEWLVDHTVPFVLVFTKTDKVKPAVVQSHVDAFADEISAWSDNLPEMYRCSAVKRHGRQDLLDLIEETIS